MAELILFTGVIALLSFGIWLVIDADSDDDNGGGGLMEPVLIPVRVRPRR